MTDAGRLRRQQAGVALGMGLALVVTVGAFLWPAGKPPPMDRPSLWVAASSLPAAWLAIAVALLARHRFFSADDINAAVSPAASANASVLQALIQNTLEQAVLATLAYGAWIWLASPGAAWVAVRCAALFAVGRLLFFVGYGRGAAARALGFGLTFYPTVGLLALSLPRAVTVLTSS